jgi:hypothetical protein
MTSANEKFGVGSNGSENFYTHRPSLILYSDAVRDMAEECEAYWLIDLIVSHQSKKDVNLERFQVWDLKRVKDHAYKIVATDGNHNEVASQKIPFSDFPFDTASIWLVDGVMMMPSEY